MVSSQKPPRREPTQARAKATYEVILRAAEELLTGQASGGFTTNAVAERAGVSVGSLYQYFSGRADLLAALRRRYAAAVGQSLLDVVEAHPEATCAQLRRRLIRADIDAHLAHSALHRALSAEQSAGQRPRRLDPQADAPFDLAFKGIVDAARRQFPERDAVETERQVGAVLAVSAALIEVEILDARRPVDPERLEVRIHEVIRAIVEAPPDRGALDAAVSQSERRR